jgi:hypothetical protein|tara:strand:- start:3177 stop:3608 length:432 start_codon:yes stop_codon:yes gene_type:complete
MVNNMMNVSAYNGSPPNEVGDGRIYISGGPLYPIEDIVALLDADERHTILWTRQCKSHVQQLAYEIGDVQQLIKQAVTQGRYLNSEWCAQKPTGPWAACDGYRLLRDEWVDHAHKEMRFEYYVKFAIGKTGKLLLLVSCHLSH